MANGIRNLFNEPEFLAFIGDLTGKSVLDAACGDGYFTRRLAARRIVGIDISPRMIQRARARLPGTEFHVAFLLDLEGFSDQGFDVVVSFMALMDVPEMPKAVANLAHVIKPGGLLAFSVRHPCFLAPSFSVAPVGPNRVPRLAVGHYFSKEPRLDTCVQATEIKIPRFPYTLSDYMNAVAAAGLRIVRLLEPRPSEEACARVPMLAFWREHAAMFLYVAAEKP